MKLLMAGDWGTDIFEEPLAQAFEKEGFDVIKFKWNKYFSELFEKGYISNIISRIQYKYMFGPLVKKLNIDLLKKVREEKPSILFVYRGSHIYSSTLKKIKTEYPNIYIISYNNDDPFSSFYSWWQWRHFFKNVLISDLVLSFRESNILKYREIGVRNIDFFRGYFNPNLHQKIDRALINQSEFTTDIVFIGHYEDDGRMEMIDALAGEGFDVKIFGPNGSSRKSGWGEAISRSKFLKSQKVRTVKGYEYVLALNSAKIGLCFLSKINNDTYTLRCFEIPACGTALFSEWTPDLDNLFENGVNAVLFNNKEELIKSVKFYLSNLPYLEKMAELGYQSVYKNGHDVNSRAKWLIDKYNLHSKPGTGK